MPSTHPRSALSSMTSHWRRVRRRVLLHRRLVAAAAAGGAVLLGLQAAAPPPQPSVTVWAAKEALPGGAVVEQESLEALQLPAHAVPEEAVRDPDEVVGRPLVAPLTRGETLTRLRVLGPGLSAAYPGSTAVPVRFADAEVADLLRPGDRVDLVSAGDEGRDEPRVLAASVPVVAVPDPSTDGTLSSGSPGAPGRLVVLAVPRHEAAAVAAATATGILMPLWSR